MGPSPTVGCLLSGLGELTLDYHIYCMVLLLTAATAATACPSSLQGLPHSLPVIPSTVTPCLQIQYLRRISLIGRNMFHPHSQLPSINFHCLKASPKSYWLASRLSTVVDWMVWNIWNSTMFILWVDPRLDRGTFPAYSRWPASSTGNTSAHPVVAEPNLECFVSQPYNSSTATKATLVSVQLTGCSPLLPPLYMNMHTQWTPYLSHPIGTLWQPNNILASPNWNCLTTKYHPFPHGDTIH